MFEFQYKHPKLVPFHLQLAISIDHDRWDIESAADSLIKAESIRNDKRKGFYATVMKEVDKKAKDADDAAATAHKAVRKVSVGGIFKTPGQGNPHKGGY